MEAGGLSKGFNFKIGRIKNKVGEINPLLFYFSLNFYLSAQDHTHQTPKQR
jgi:hypothetical protein